MDYVKQNLEVVNQWADVQLKTWTGWFEAVQKADKFDPALIWNKTLDASQESVHKTLEAQEVGSQMFFKEVVAVKGLPREVVALTEKLQTLTEQWFDLETQAYDNYFATLKQTNLLEFPSKLFPIQPSPVKVAA
ncbi:MAG: hypothetical protein U0401_23100 [Anaerolineae bacterium]